MSFASVIDRLDDWVNPIVVKELRQAVKSRLVVLILMGFLSVQLIVMGWYLAVRNAQSQFGSDQWSGGAQVFNVLQWVLLPTLMLVIPAHAGIRFGSERTGSNVDLLFISTLKPAQIVWGKFIAAFVLAMLVLSMVAPFMMFAYLLRGIDLPTIFLVLSIDLLAMVAATIWFLFLGSIPGGRPVKVFFTIMGIILLLYAFGGVGAATWEILNGGVGRLMRTAAEFWATAGVVAAIALGEIALLFFYTVAIISPPSSNRILPIRLCVLGYWLVSAAALFSWSKLAARPSSPDQHVLVIFWMMLGLSMLVRQMLISVCERDAWGPRIRRCIPRNPLGRFFAFLLYTGSGGGIAFTLTLMALTLGIAAAFLYSLALSPHFEGTEVALGVGGATCLYAASYCLSAFVLRAYLLHEQMRSGLTWILVVLLLGIGMAGPALVVNVFFWDNLRNGHDNGWWLLANPFFTAYELTNTGNYKQAVFVSMAWAFLTAWTGVVLLLTVPLVFSQMGQFRPHVSLTPEREG